MITQYPKVTIGIVLFGTKYLAQSLPSLLASDYPNLEVRLLDQQDPDWQASELIHRELPQVLADPRVHLSQGANLWHSGGHNLLIRQALESGSQYYIAGSNDMLYAPDTISALVSALEDPANNRYGFAAPKLLIWDFESGNKTDQIDSAGLSATAGHHFVDRAQGQIDTPELDHSGPVFGASGALAIYRCTALQAVAYQGEFFDELLHYKNDVDLSYRLNWAGYHCLFVPSARAWHDRQLAGRGGWLAAARARLSTPRWAKESSFFGQAVLLAKNFSPQYSWRVRLTTRCTQLVRYLWALLAEPYLWRQLLRCHEQAAVIAAKKSALVRQISASAMELHLTRPATQRPAFDSTTSKSDSARPMVSVVILDFLKSKRVVENVESLQHQKTKEPIEIIVADNSCNAANAAKLQELVKYPNVKLIFNPINLGYTRGCNAGARQARGRHILILNPDIVLRQTDVLQRLVDYLDAHPQVGIVGPQQINEPSGQIAMTVREFPRLWVQIARRTWLRYLPIVRQVVAADEMQQLDQKQIQPVDWLQSSCVLVRRELWEMVGGLDETYFLFMSDPELCWQTWQLGYQVIYHPGVQVYADGLRCSAGGFLDFFRKWTLRQHLADSIRYRLRHFGCVNPRH